MTTTPTNLAALLSLPHPIVQDIAARHARTGRISERQLALVEKLNREATEKTTRQAAQDAEIKVAAPTGKITFRGTVVSVKQRDGYRGALEYKATLKVTTDAGVWIAWGTVPAAILHTVSDPWGWGGEQRVRAALVGRPVDVKATVTRSDRDEHFAFAKRPTWTFADTFVPVLPKNKKEQAPFVGSAYYLAIEMLFTGIANLLNGLTGSAMRGIIGGVECA